MSNVKNLATQEMARSLDNQIAEIGSGLYTHYITICDLSGVERYYVMLDIDSPKAEAFTYNDIATFLSENGFVDTGVDYSATGEDSYSAGVRAVIGIFYNATESKIVYRTVGVPDRHDYISYIEDFAVTIIDVVISVL